MSKAPIRPIPVGGKTAPEKLKLKKFADRLKELRVERGLSQSDLARLIWGETTDERGYKVANKRGRISAYEAGRAIPEPHNLTSLAEALGVTIEELAPDVVAAAVDHAEPEIAINMVPGGDGVVHLQVNTLVDLDTAMQIGVLLSRSQAAKKSSTGA